MRKIGLGSCPKCDATLLPEGSSYAVIQRIVQDPLSLLNLVGWVILAMSVVALIATRG
jgi:hypothetical protein